MVGASPAAQAATSSDDSSSLPTREAMWEKIQEQQKQIEALADVLEPGLGHKTGGSSSPTHLGGYGELHYNDTDSGREIDFHRFVIFISHRFNDQISFHSELEVEHSIAGESQVGEVELEQAYLQWDYSNTQRFKSGLFLVPVGFINETHEPDVFYGVERNNVEKNIIPATWWEGGLALQGEIAEGWSYDLAVHSGLNLDTTNASASKRSSIRSARQKVGEANADSLAYTARLKFSGIPGLQWALSVQYQEDLTQDDADNIGIDRIGATLIETGLSLERAAFSLKALYARWDIDDPIELLNPGAGSQLGWYVEPSYRFSDKWGLFARYSSYNLTEDSSLFSNDQAQFDLGINFWLHPNVVFKIDYQKQTKDAGLEDDGFNLGVGYSF